MLLIFIKAPRPGFVKTRLAQTLGAKEAALAYSLIASEVCDRLNSLSNVELRYAPEDGRGEIDHWLQKDWIASPQGEGNLGKRLGAAFAEKLQRGVERVLVIGSDCPYVGVGDVNEAYEALEGADVVLGPALDGGYWLIGLSVFHRGLFDDISWSTDRVLAQTLAKAKELNLTVKLLRELEDIDTPESWSRFILNREQ